MDFFQAIAKTAEDLQSNPTWQREVFIGQGIDPLHANVMAQKAGEDQERKQMVAMIRARIDAGQPITESELLAIGSVNPDLARMVIQMQEPKKPNNQYMLDPNTGRVITVNKDTGMAGYAPFGDYSGGGEMPTGAPDGLPSLDVTAQPPASEIRQPPPGLNPVDREKWMEAEIKRVAAQEKAAPAKTRGLETVSTMRGIINDLAESGNLRDSSKSPASNIANYVAGTALGREANKALGTERIDQYELLAQHTPAIIMDIMAAADMGVTQINTEKELEFWKQIAGGGDGPMPSKKVLDAAMDRLERMYGEMGQLRGDIPAQPQQPDFGGFKILGVE